MRGEPRQVYRKTPSAARAKLRRDAGLVYWAQSTSRLIDPVAIIAAMDLTVPSHFFFDPEEERQPRSSRQIDDKTDREQRLFCACCRHLITHRRYEFAMNGAHAHDFTNPHGISFRIGCFREAAGCVEFGAPTTEFTWFPGYAWTIANCAGCDTHLGWFFTSPSDGFYGLIVNRLSSEKA